MRLAINMTMNTKNRILAICVAVPAMPPNPSTAAMIATIRKIKAQRSMMRLFPLLSPEQV